VLLSPASNEPIPLRPASAAHARLEERDGIRRRAMARTREGTGEECLYNFTPNLFYNGVNKKTPVIYPPLRGGGTGKS